MIIEQVIYCIIKMEYLLHNKNGESCKAKMAKVAAPKWRKLQRVLDKS